MHDTIEDDLAPSKTVKPMLDYGHPHYHEHHLGPGAPGLQDVVLVGNGPPLGLPGQGYQG